MGSKGRAPWRVQGSALRSFLDGFDNLTQPGTAMASSLANLRNIGIIAHIDAGKTTLSERILFYTDKIHRMGEVHEGAATMDFLPEEQDRGITIASACTSCTWNQAAINLSDTPGHVDFTIEVERSLRVLDGAVGVFCAVSGVEPQSETVWRQSEKFHIPKLAFVNKMDRPGASYAATLDAMRRRLGANPVPVTIPLGEGDEFDGVLDLIHRESLRFDQADQGRTVLRAPFTAAEQEMAAPWRENLLETLAEFDDALLEIYLAGEAPEPALVHQTLRRAVLERRVVAVFAGSALRNAGVQPLLDGIEAYLPSPLDVPPVEAHDTRDGSACSVAPDAGAPLCALVFKVYMEGGRKLALLRLYAGTLTEGAACRNVSRSADERATRIFRLNAGRREAIDKAFAGDIVAAQGLKSVRTGDSIATLARPLLLENIAAYIPVISLALEPKNTEEGKKLDEALERFCVEDPTLKVELDEASGQRLVSGMGELHLEVLLDRMRRECDLAPRAGNPQVVHQESIARPGSASGEFDRELGEQHHYGYVELSVAPLPRDEGNSVQVAFPLEGWPKFLSEAVTQGVTDALQCGPLGYAVQDVAVTVTKLGRKEGMTTPAGFRMAAAMALKNALQEGGPLLLEPIMDVELNVPEAVVGPAIALLGARGGKVEEMRDEGGHKVVRALAPMRELFGFSTALRSATQGRAGLVMRFAKFDSAS